MLDVRVTKLALKPPFFEIAKGELNASKMISAPLKEMMIDQSETLVKPQLRSIKAEIHHLKHQHITTAAQEVKEQLPQPLQRAMDLASEKGTSTWLTALPLQDQRFNLNKREFQDALSLQYGWQLKNLPQHYICGTTFSTDHAMICPNGGLPIISHNEIWDITANWLSEVCHDVERELHVGLDNRN